MLVNTLYIKIHNQIQVHFSVVYTFYKLRNEFCFNNTNCNARIDDMFFTTVVCVLRVRWQGGINLRMQRLECFFLDWTVGDYSISSHISVVTYLRDKDLNYLPWRDSPQWAKASSVSRIHGHTHLDTQHSIGFLRTIDQPEAETSTWQHTTLRNTNILVPGGIRTHNPSKRVAADPRLWPRGHWDRPKSWINRMKSTVYDMYHQVKHKFSSFYPRMEVLCLICRKNRNSIP